MAAAIDNEDEELVAVGRQPDGGAGVQIIARGLDLTVLQAESKAADGDVNVGGIIFAGGGADGSFAVACDDERW